MAIEIVDFPIKNGGSFHCYVKLPEGIWNWFEIFTGIQYGYPILRQERIGWRKNYSPQPQQQAQVLGRHCFPWAIFL